MKAAICPKCNEVYRHPADRDMIEIYNRCIHCIIESHNTASSIQKLFTFLEQTNYGWSKVKK